MARQPTAAHARSQRRELIAQTKARAISEEQRAAYEVRLYESLIACLISMHKEVGPFWNWPEIATRRPPPPPSPTNAFESQARSAAAGYEPSLFDRWFGCEQRKRARLDRAIVEARRRDEEWFAAAYAAYMQQFERLAWEQRVASGVLRGDLNAYKTVLDTLTPFRELAESGMQVALEGLRLDVAVLRCAVSETAVPREERRLTPTGKLSVKALSATAYWRTYQDYVCGSALRAAREMFALLPIPRVVVNVGTYGFEGSTGHYAYLPVLGVSIAREVAERLRFDTLDPSDSMRHFPHRMRFKKTMGFDLIEPMTADEAFVPAPWSS